MKKGSLILAIAVLFGFSSLQNMMAINLLPGTIVLADEDVKYEEMQTSELPATINESIQKSYAEYTIAKAYLGSDGTYKVKLTKDDENKIAYYSAEGEFLKSQDAKQEMSSDQSTK